MEINGVATSSSGQSHQQCIASMTGHLFSAFMPLILDPKDFVYYVGGLPRSQVDVPTQTRRGRAHRDRAGIDHLFLEPDDARMWTASYIF